MVVTLIVTVVAVVLLLCLAVMRWLATRAIEDADLYDDELEPARGLPEGHQPPPGLSPLSPSERFLAAEAERGLRDLQAYLLDAA